MKNRYIGIAPIKPWHFMEPVEGRDKHKVGANPHFQTELRGKKDRFKSDKVPYSPHIYRFMGGNIMNFD